METRYSGLEERMEKSLEVWKWSLNQKVKNLEKKHLEQKFTETMNTAIATLKDIFGGGGNR